MTVLQQNRFLQEYAQNGNIKVACESAGISRGSHRNWMRDPDFAERFEEARLDAVNVLEAEAYRRAVTGWDEPLVYQGSLSVHPKTKKPVTVKKYDSTLLIFLMKGAAPEKYRDTWKGEIKHTAVVSRGPDLSKLTDDQLEYLEHLAASLASADEAIAGPAGIASGAAEAAETQD